VTQILILFDDLVTIGPFPRLLYAVGSSRCARAIRRPNGSAPAACDGLLYSGSARGAR
jgi:hypothetical protein